MWRSVVVDVVTRAMKEFEVPGIAVGVIQDGKVAVAKGFGVRKLGESAPVTERTLFGIASNTKAFTSAALAILVDEKKLEAMIEACQRGEYRPWAH